MERPEFRNTTVQAAGILGACLFLGLVLGGWLLGGQIKAIKLADRYVTVKGLVERTVKSDTAIWPVSFKEAGNDLSQVFAKSEADKASCGQKKFRKSREWNLRDFRRGADPPKNPSGRAGAGRP